MSSSPTMTRNPFPTLSRTAEESGNRPGEDYWPFFTHKGEEFCLEDEALAALLHESVVFPNGREYHCPWEGKRPETVVLFVNCNDLFAWGCADAEELPFSEIGRLFKIHRADPRWGVSKWCCLRRGMRPQAPVERDWRSVGAWDAEMEALPPRDDRR